MTQLLDSTQLAIIDHAITALINNGNAPVDTAWALDELRNAILDAETALTSNDTSALETAVSDLQDAMDGITAQLADMGDVDDSLQSDVTALQTAVTDYGTAITALQASDTAQNSSITAIQTKNTTQDGLLTGIATKDSSQDGLLSGIATKDTSQDGQITTEHNTNATQDTAIAALQAAANLVNNVPATPARSLNTAFRPSTTRPTDVSYSVPITAVAALITGQRGKAYLRYADDSGMTTNVVQISQDDFGIGSGLVVTGYAALKLIGRIPANKWAMIVTENTTGSPTFGAVSVQETTL